MDQDILFPNPFGCSYFQELLSIINYIKLFAAHHDYIDKLNELKNELKKVDSDVEDLTFNGFRDDIAARKVTKKKKEEEKYYYLLIISSCLNSKAQNLPVPNNLLPFYEIAKKYATMEFTKRNSQDIKLSCGLFLNLLRHNFLECAKRDESKEK
jgi:hypothetical protein